MDAMTSMVLAEASPLTSEYAIAAAVLSAAAIIVGAAIGIAIIAKNAVNAISRQPEAGGRIFTAMIVGAALLEGVTFFALLICLLTVLWLK
jgi:F-type H+-transporting ATPase subunit c